MHAKKLALLLALLHLIFLISNFMFLFWMGAKGITVSGVCCTSNEVTMRHGIPMAGNYLNQENVVLTGACEAIVVIKLNKLPRFTVWLLSAVLV